MKSSSDGVDADKLDWRLHTERSSESCTAIHSCRTWVIAAFMACGLPRSMGRATGWMHEASCAPRYEPRPTTSRERPCRRSVVRYCVRSVPIPSKRPASVRAPFWSGISTETQHARLLSQISPFRRRPPYMRRGSGCCRRRHSQRSAQTCPRPGPHRATRHARRRPHSDHGVPRSPRILLSHGTQRHGLCSLLNKGPD